MIGIPPISIFVLAFYATVGGILICCLETQLKFLRVMIAVNFGFLFSSFFRFLYYMLLAAICWSYKSLLGKIVAIAIIATAFLNTYVLCRYPSYRKIREKVRTQHKIKITYCECITYLDRISCACRLLKRKTSELSHVLARRSSDR
jgi:hypothetical protein